MLGRASIIDQKVREFSFCNFPSRDVRFMQNEDTLAVPTQPPAIAVLALMDLALLAGEHSISLSPTN
jgi:hypothetical protein